MILGYKMGSQIPNARFGWPTFQNEHVSGAYKCYRDTQSKVI